MAVAFAGPLAVGLALLAAGIDPLPAARELDPATLAVVLQAGGGDPVLSRVVDLPTYRWFEVGYVCFGLAMGLAVASQYVGFQRDLRSTRETVDDAEQYVDLFLLQARVTSVESDSPSTLLRILAFVAFVPGVLWWFGRFFYWLAVETPGDLGTKLQLLFAGLLVIVPFAVLGMSFGIPLCVGLAIYVETLVRGLRVLFW